MLENKVIITNESNKNKIYEKSKNKWIIELDGSKINSWDDFYKIIQKKLIFYIMMKNLELMRTLIMILQQILHFIMK